MMERSAIANVCFSLARGLNGYNHGYKVDTEMAAGATTEPEAEVEDETAAASLYVKYLFFRQIA